MRVQLNEDPEAAVKICFDHAISLAHHPDRPPPSFYCSECASKLIRDQGIDPKMFEDINHPIDQAKNWMTV